MSQFEHSFSKMILWIFILLLNFGLIDDNTYALFTMGMPELEM